MRDIDGQDTEPDDILEPPTDLSTSYTDYDDYSEQWDEIVECRNDATHEIDDKIAGLQSQLEELTTKYHEISQPFNEEQDALAREYEKSRKVLARSLWLDYEGREDDWSRKGYDLGYPEGCILVSVKKGDTLQQFLIRINREKITKDIQEELQSDYESGTIDDIIESLLNNKCARAHFRI